MKCPVTIATIATALAASAAAARDFPPMDVMGPYDTPAIAADRIVVPEPASDAGRQQSELAIERAASGPIDDNTLGGLLSAPGRDGDQGNGHGGEVEVGDLGGNGDGRDDDDDKPGKPEKPEKPDKPEKPEKPDDDGDG